MNYRLDDIFYCTVGGRSSSEQYIAKTTFFYWWVGEHSPIVNKSLYVIFYCIVGERSPLVNNTLNSFPIVHETSAER